MLKEIKKIKQLNSSFILRSIEDEAFNFKVNTDKAKFIETGNKHSYTFSITRTNNDNFIENLVLISNSEGGYNAVLVKYDFTYEQYLNITKEDFNSRKIMYTPINYDYKNLVKKNTNRSTGWGCSESWEVVAVISPRTFGVSHYEWVLVSSNCGFFSNYDSYGTEDIGGGDMYTSPMEGDFGSGGGGAGDSPSLALEDDKINLDPSFKNSKAYCAYLKLQENLHFKSILDKLIPENSKYSVTFIVAPISASGGVTDATFNPYDNEISVTINSFLVENRSIVSVAEAILHESVHARLYEMVKSIGGLDSLSEFTNEESEIGKLAACFNKYDTQKQHTFMWENYVDEIAKGVDFFHQLYPEDYLKFHSTIMKDVVGYSKNTFYQDIAKASLSKTSYFNKLDSLEQKRIIGLSGDLSVNAKKITDYKTCE